MLLNFIFYVIFTPLIATAMTKVMFMSENGMIVADNFPVRQSSPEVKE